MGLPARKDLDKLSHLSRRFLTWRRVCCGGHAFGRSGEMNVTRRETGIQERLRDRSEEATCVFLGMPAVIASEPMRRLMATVERVARANTTVLIQGESGTGKELVARAVHHYSMRSQRPWVDLSCAALPEHLLESELFGHEKGAFSGADSNKPGLFELAHQGTIFLDEIGELDIRMQVKLLRVLDRVPYYRLGGVRNVTVAVRVVAATTQDLEAPIASRQCPRQLYHRLRTIT